MSISEKELKAIELRANGHNIREIAIKMFSNRESIRGLFSSLYNKTGTRNGAHLVSWAYQNALLPISITVSINEFSTSINRSQK